MTKRKWEPLPDLNVREILDGECPPLQTVEQNKNGAVKYAIWRYINCGEKLTVITDNIGAKSYVNVIYWLKQYDVYEKNTSERRSNNDPKLKRTKKFEHHCKELYDNGYLTYTDIAKEMNCEATIVSEVAKKNGWTTNKPTRQFEWIVPKSLPENDINDYGKYRRTIHYFTKIIVERYFSESDKQKLKTGKYDIDHILSIYEGFNKGVKPLSWTLLIHPCNLQVILTKENIIKRHHSGHSPKELKEKIIAFEKIHGKVSMPIQISNNRKTFPIIK